MQVIQPIVLACITLCPFYFCAHLDEEERAGCFAFIVLRMSCYCICYVPIPQGAVGRSWYFLIILTYFSAVNINNDWEIKCQTRELLSCQPRVTFT